MTSTGHCRRPEMRSDDHAARRMVARTCHPAMPLSQARYWPHGSSHWLSHRLPTWGFAEPVAFSTRGRPLEGSSPLLSLHKPKQGGSSRIWICRTPRKRTQEKCWPFLRALQEASPGGRRACCCHAVQLAPCAAGKVPTLCALCVEFWTL